MPAPAHDAADAPTEPTPTLEAPSHTPTHAVTPDPWANPPDTTWVEELPLPDRGDTEHG